MEVAPWNLTIFEYFLFNKENISKYFLSDKENNKSYRMHSIKPTNLFVG